MEGDMDGVPVATGIIKTNSATGMPRGRGMRRHTGRAQEITADVARLRIGFVNVYFVGRPDIESEGWTLVDAGLPGSAGRIRRAAEERFGVGAKPNAIVLTHAHFDHVGALKTLAEEWDVPIYAHTYELPYLTGRSPYPPFDPAVGGGAMAAMSWMYPRGPIDVAGRVRALPEDGRIPTMPGWTWFETPGHSPGHVSFFREQGSFLLAGDAIVTTKQESMMAAVTEVPVVHGPPAYATPDWESARRSVQQLSALQPEIVATGHGAPLRGAEMREALTTLAIDFTSLAVPSKGRYVDNPARADERGVQWIPPEPASTRRMRNFTLGGTVVALALLAFALGRRSEARSYSR
jgi:glyoxylase-like metal-dependent hydrolase (beta-lactamase superfamily II)